VPLAKLLSPPNFRNFLTSSGYITNRNLMPATKKPSKTRKHNTSRKTADSHRRRFARTPEERAAARRGTDEARHHEVEDVTTDSLQLFFNAARKYPLLTAAEEVELAQRIEKGDVAAKDRMI